MNILIGVSFAVILAALAWAGIAMLRGGRKEGSKGGDMMRALAHTAPIGVLLRDRDSGEVRVGRDGHPVVEIASDLHVREPAHEVPGVLLPARTECHVRALQKRSEHRSGQNSRTSTL